MIRHFYSYFKNKSLHSFNLILKFKIKKTKTNQTNDLLHTKKNKSNHNSVWQNTKEQLNNVFSKIELSDHTFTKKTQSLSLVSNDDVYITGDVSFSNATKPKPKQT